MEGMDATRVDKWLWAVRLCKTRSAATDACNAGHVQVNGQPAKPAHPVRVGDRVEARLYDRQRIVDVVRVIEKRVSAPTAAECLVDHSPPPPPKEEWFPNFARDVGAGRPTKKDRRGSDSFRKSPDDHERSFSPEEIDTRTWPMPRHGCGATAPWRRERSEPVDVIGAQRP